MSHTMKHVSVYSSFGDEYPLTFGRTAHPMNGRSDAMTYKLGHESLENRRSRSAMGQLATW